MVPPPRRRRIRQSANMLRDKSILLKLENKIVLLFISYLKAWCIVSTCRACVSRLLLDGMLIPRGRNRPNQLRRVCRAD
jgi:hypothetical protein